MSEPNTLLANNQPETIDPAKDYFAELVGPNGKFKDVQALARGKVESDLYIKHKEQQFDQLRDDYLKLKAEHDAVPKMQEFLDQLKSTQISRDEINTPPMSNPDTKTAFDPKELEPIFDQKLQQYEANRQQTENYNKVRAKLEERYGPKYQDALAKQATELGMSDDEITTLARRNPRLFERTFGLDQPVQQETFQAPPRGSERRPAQPTNTKRTWSYYQNMKKTDPAQYLSNKTQWQMHQDAIALGDEFADGDFNAL